MSTMQYKLNIVQFYFVDDNGIHYLVIWHLNDADGSYYVELFVGGKMVNRFVSRNQPTEENSVFYISIHINP